MAQALNPAGGQKVPCKVVTARPKRPTRPGSTGLSLERGWPGPVAGASEEERQSGGSPGRVRKSPAGSRGAGALPPRVPVRLRPRGSRASPARGQDPPRASPGGSRAPADAEPSSRGPR